MKLLSSTLLVTVLAPTPVLAQSPFSTDIGSVLVAGDDTMHDVVAGFAVIFPDGSATTEIRIDSNGRITPTSAADSSDFSESIAELLEIPTFAPMWDDLSPQDGPSSNGCDVWFFTDNTQANITWIDCEDFTFDGTYTFQCQLFADGRINFAYDSRVTGQDGLVGLSDGTTVDPGGSDLSVDAASSFGFVSVYELFGSGAFDLGGMSIEFTPVVSGYTIATGASGTAPTCPVTLPFDGDCTDIGKATNRAYEYTPDGSGAYAITHAIGTFVDDSAIALDLNSLAVGTGDDELYTVSLGFPFTMPDGSVVTDIVIDTNGRVLADATDPSDFNPSVFEATGSAPASICPFWCDMTPQLASAYWFAADATEARITMLDAPQFAESNRISWQLTLRADNSFQINYIDTGTWRTGFGSTTDDVLAGCFSGTGGTGADPLSSEHADLVNLTNSEGTFYQFWDAGPVPGDAPSMQCVLDCVGTPALGGTLDIRATGITTGALAPTLFLGFTDTIDVPLDPIGIEGGVFSNSCDLSMGLTVIGDEATLSIPLPPNPGFIGLLEIDLQVAYAAFTDTTLGAVLSNGVAVTFPP